MALREFQIDSPAPNEAVNATKIAAKPRPRPAFQPQGMASSTACPPISDHAVKIARIATRNSLRKTILRYRGAISLAVAPIPVVR